MPEFWSQPIETIAFFVFPGVHLLFGRCADSQPSGRNFKTTPSIRSSKLEKQTGKISTDITQVTFGLVRIVAQCRQQWKKLLSAAI